MISRNLRHFRVFLAVVDLAAPGLAAARCGVSQPAVTQALAKLDAECGGPLFKRSRAGFFPTARGNILALRLRRGMEGLDRALAAAAPRLVVTATAAQLQALVAMVEEQNFTLAARRLGRAQPTVHRAVTQLEREVARPLFERTPFGVVATRICREIAGAVRLAFSEFEQAEADLAELEGREHGRIVVGSLPLSRSVLLPEAIARFRAERRRHCVTVVDGPYDEMLHGLRRGEIDVILGALRDPLPIDDVVQEALFDDGLLIVARPGHPLLARGGVTLEQLVSHPWAVPRPGTPSRDQFDAQFTGRGLPLPESIVECGSILLMRELLGRSDLLGCISARQAEAEIARGLLARVEAGVSWPARPIGLTTRRGWQPTRAQALLLDHLRDVAAGMP